MKPCTQCHESKELDEFPIRSARPDGRASECKRCHSDRVAEYRRKRANDPRHILSRVWWGMMSRCTNPNVSAYKYYGGRGISVEFRDRDHFTDWSLANGWEPGLEVDRIDNDGPYSPDNCRWVTRSVNLRNRSDNFTITAFGETKTLVEWVDDPRCVVERSTLKHRIVSQWEPELAITKPSILTVTAFGETKKFSDWANDPRCVVSSTTLTHRIVDYGWEPERAITEPSRWKGNKDDH